ncbi:MAG: nucleoside deaminase [Chitinophagales bacterium]|nr:nucleoside deaminase [Chitinophagales bacterium]
MFTDEYFMRLALQQANLAFTANEIPIGAIVVCNNTIVAKAYNQTELLQDVTAHAEILAITAAANYLGSKYLPNCALYVTVEPCLMCSGASYWAQLGKVVYGAADEKRGFTTLQKPVFHPKTQVVGGILATECAALMSDFFKQKR